MPASLRGGRLLTALVRAAPGHGGLRPARGRPAWHLPLEGAGRVLVVRRASCMVPSRPVELHPRG